MDGLTLLREARQAGLFVTTHGQSLVVQGPRRLEPVARRLLAAKASIIDALTEEQEVAWRVAAMRPQMTRTGAIPLLLARSGAPFEVGGCCSCGDTLVPGERYRCRPCVAAVVAVLETGP